MAYQFRTAIGQNIYNQKYSHEGAYTWPQLSEQLVREVLGCEEAAMCGAITQDDIRELTQYVTDMKFIPGGRYLYYAGRPLKAYNNCGSGRTRLLTDRGWVHFEDVVGEQVNLLSPVDGKYKPATMHYHGVQPLYRYTLGPVRGRSKETYNVEFTQDHKWLLMNGTTTTDLRVGDVVPANAQCLDRSDEGFAHGFVFGDGGANGMLRLCGRKGVQYLERLARVATSVTYPFSAAGEPYLYFKQAAHGEWKNLPNDSSSAEYRASFIAGWLAADGHTGTYTQLSSVNPGNLHWFRAHAALAGLVVAGKLRHQDRNITLGKYSYQNHRIYLQNYSTGSKWAGFKVLSKEYIGLEAVYCPFEPEFNQMVIDHGIRTYQCYLLKGEEDTREEWGSLLKRASDCLMTGGGIGIDYSVFRAEGTHLKRTGGKASGPIPLMNSVNETGRNVMQGGSRRSAIYASLNWKHGDATAFLTMKDWHNMRIGNQIADGGHPYTVWHAKQEDFNFHAPLDMTNVSLNYDDAWLFMKNRDKDLTFRRNVEQALRTGEPGFSFNFGTKQNETLRNACVIGSTALLTDAGYFPIQELVGKQVNVWNGRQFSAVTPFSTGVNELVRVAFTDGSDIVCTPYHKFIVCGDGKIEAQYLKNGQALAKWALPVVSTEGMDLHSRSDAYSQGFYSGDGNTGYTYSYVYDTKYCCEPSLIGTLHRDAEGRKVWRHGPMLEKTFVPTNASLFYKLNWLAGILDSDGTVTRDVNGNGLQIAAIDKQFLLDIRLMLSTLGVRAKVVSGADAGYRELPDGKGGHASYYCQQGYRLLIGNTDTYSLLLLGLSCHRLVLHKNQPQRDARRFVRVKSVEWLGTEAETFCVTEPLLNNMTINGIVTGNCCEVVSADDSDCCNLGSVNMSRIESIDEFRDVVRLASKFLVCGTLCGDVPFEKVRQVRDKNRRLGLGLMGMHEWLLKRGYKYEVTPELHDWLWVYREYSKKGADELCDALHISRPIAYRAIAPTGTIGMIAGTTTGIEPLFAVAYKRRYLKGSHQWYYQYTIDGTAKVLVEEYGLDPDTIDTAYSMSHEPEKRIKFQADVQDYVDMAISSTINLPEWGSNENNEDTVEDFASTLSRYAPRLRGFTVYPDGSRGGQPLTECTYAEALSHGDTVYEDNESCKGGICGL